MAGFGEFTMKGESISLGDSCVCVEFTLSPPEKQCIISTCLPLKNNASYPLPLRSDDPSKFTEDHEAVFTDALVASVGAVVSADQVVDVTAMAVSTRRVLRASVMHVRSLLEDTSIGLIEVEFTLQMRLEAYNFSGYSGEGEEEFASELLDKVGCAMIVCM